MIFFGPLIILGMFDITQKSHSILRNFPVLGHMRFLLEEIRPEIYQYFVESDTGGLRSIENREALFISVRKMSETPPLSEQ